MQNHLIVFFAFGVLFPALGKEKEPKREKGAVKVYTTARDTNLRLSYSGLLKYKQSWQPLETETSVFVDPQKTFQTFVGIGGAISDASAETFYKLSDAKQKELINAYYNPVNGIGYSLARTNINSCDFSSGSYTYVKDNDKSLASFDIAHDRQYKMPMIKAATKIAGGKLPLYVSPWSPPAWMKTNNNMLKGGKLLSTYRQAWANYYIKFMEAYETDGIPIWGLTVQNEPMATQTWESCIYSAEEERDFIKYYLGPTLHKNNMQDKKLIGWDHNRDLLFQRANTLLSDEVASKYIWGIGFHWYETWTGGGMQFNNLKRVAESYPDKHLIFTEGCVEKFDLTRVHDWSLGERYGYSMVNDFNAGTVAWTDWNVLLDEKGGPNHVGNFCFAPIHANIATDELIYTNSYYYLGHFSKFIRPGAKRIICSSSRDTIQTTAFVNTDGSIAVVILNLTDEKIDYNLFIGDEAVTTTSLPHSISTLVI